MKNKLFTILWSGLLITVVAWGQPGPPDEGFGPPDDDFMMPRKMEAVRIYKLTQALNLTDDQITKFIPVLQKHEAAFREEQQKLKAIMEDGRKLLNGDELSQKDVTKFMERVTTQQAKIQATNQDFFKSLDKYLTPRQQLQYLAFEERFRRQLREFIQERQMPPGRQQRMDGRKP